MSNQGFINHRKDEETIRYEILTNICRMLINRGNMDINKYCLDEYITSGADFANIIYNISASIDDNKVRKMFNKDDVKKNIIEINVDVQFTDDKKREGFGFDGTKIIVIFIPHKVTDVKNSETINEVLKTYQKNRKLFVMDSIVDKAETILLREKNIEIFRKDDLMIDFMSIGDAPHRCSVDRGGKNIYVVKPNMPRIHANDPLSKYYAANIDDIIEIIGTSSVNGFARRYRKVIEAKPVFSK